jgi:hypothetical protein
MALSKKERENIQRKAHAFGMIVIFLVIFSTIITYVILIPSLGWEQGIIAGMFLSGFLVFFAIQFMVPNIV